MSEGHSHLSGSDAPGHPDRGTLRDPARDSRTALCGGLLLPALLIAAAACTSDVNEPSTDRTQLEPVAGLYALVDASGAVADGGRSRLTLDLPRRETRPSFGWSVFPSGGVNAPRPGGDLGTWARADARIEFRSVSEGRTYAGTLVGVGSGDANTLPGPTLVLPVLGAGEGTYTFRRVRTAADPGAYLSVALVGPGGALVAGGTATITAPDGIVVESGFSGSVPFTTQGPPGEWAVAVAPPTGYVLAPGEPNPATVVVPGGQTPTVLRVRVVQTAGP